MYGCRCNKRDFVTAPHYIPRRVERMVFSLTGRRPGFGTIYLLASASSALFGRRTCQRKT
jgi:hypothetical protein